MIDLEWPGCLKRNFYQKKFLMTTSLAIFTRASRKYIEAECKQVWIRYLGLRIGYFCPACPSSLREAFYEWVFFPSSHGYLPCFCRSTAHMCNLIRHHLILCGYLLTGNNILKHWRLCKKTGVTREDPPELGFSTWLDSMAITYHHFFD
jgi:hypothetical protein